jgi:DNA-binding NtrC family response regulator
VPPSRAPSSVPGGKTRILVVDDTAPLRAFVAKALEHAGYEVIAVAGTRAAAEALAAEPVDLLVTDATLLDGSGTALARSARTVRPDLPVIVMSGSDERDGVFDVALSKPFDEAALLWAVERALTTGQPH